MVMSQVALPSPQCEVLTEEGDRLEIPSLSHTLTLLVVTTARLCPLRCRTFEFHEVTPNIRV